MLLRAVLSHDHDFLRAHLVAHRGFHAGPGDRTDALHLAALHSKVDLARAGIAHHDLELCSEDRVRERGERVRRAARASKNQFALESLFKARDRRLRACHHHLRLPQGAPDPQELARVEPRAIRVEDGFGCDLGFTAPIAVPSFGATLKMLFATFSESGPGRFCGTNAGRQERAASSAARSFARRHHSRRPRWSRSGFGSACPRKHRRALPRR